MKKVVIVVALTFGIGLLASGIFLLTVLNTVNIESTSSANPSPKEEIERFNQDGGDTSREFRIFFAGYHCLNKKEKDEFVNKGKIPKRIEGEFKEMKEEAMEVYFIGLTGE